MGLDQIKVQASVGAKPFFSYVEGTKAQLGYIDEIFYEDRVRAPSLVSLDRTRTQKLGARLQRASALDQMVDHAEVIESVLQSPIWSLQRTAHIRDGLQVMAWFSTPELSLPKGLFSIFAEEELFAAISLRGSAKLSDHYVFTAGFYRLICKNGLIAEALRLGRLCVKSRRDLSGVSRWLQSLQFEHYDAARGISSATLSPVEEWIRLLYESQQPDLAEFPSSGQVALRAFERAPKWYLLQLCKELRLLSFSPTVNNLLLLNALTNAANSSPSEAGFLRMNDALDIHLSHLHELLSISGLMTRISTRAIR